MFAVHPGKHFIEAEGLDASERRAAIRQTGEVRKAQIGRPEVQGIGTRSQNAKRGSDIGSIRKKRQGVISIPVEANARHVENPGSECMYPIQAGVGAATAAAIQEAENLRGDAGAILILEVECQPVLLSNTLPQAKANALIIVRHHRSELEILRAATAESARRTRTGLIGFWKITQQT